MPYPKKNESKDDFISRAIRAFILEGVPKDQAIGRAYGFWETYKTKKPNKRG